MLPETSDYKIDGMRTRVFDVFYYLEAGLTHEEILAVMQITKERLDADVLFIEANRSAVSALHRQIEARHPRGNAAAMEAMADTPIVVRVETNAR